MRSRVATEKRLVAARRNQFAHFPESKRHPATHVVKVMPPSQDRLLHVRSAPSRACYSTSLRVKTAVLLFFAMVLPTRLSATAIVIVRTPTSVFIGADSVRILNGTDRVLVCKIARFGDVYTAAAGLVGYDPTAFDLSTFVEKAASVVGPLASKSASLDDTIIRPLLDMAERLRRDDPAFTSRYLNTYFVQVAFVGLENGQPAIAQRRYMPKIGVDGGLEMSVFACPSSECSADFDMFMLGETTAMRTRIKEPNSRKDVQVAIHELIELQIRDTPERVGPPINILRIGSDGAHWLEGGEVCGSL